jgi:N-acetylglucosamine kinase-like BadF-type ATPase
MSDIDRTRMIPLHIADQAVAACEAEIQKLREENARLKAQVERLKSEPDALTAYLYADTLRRDDIKTLKAHIERLTKAGDTIIQILCKYVPPTGAKYALMDWRDAKEGKGHA